jgi:hypothetical protein
MAVRYLVLVHRCDPVCVLNHFKRSGVQLQYARTKNNQFCVTRDSSQQDGRAESIFISHCHMPFSLCNL